MQFVIIVSLLAPHFFGNLAVLRIVKSLKVIKFFILQREKKKLSGEIEPEYNFYFPEPLRRLNLMVVALLSKSETWINQKIIAFLRGGK